MFSFQFSGPDGNSAYSNLSQAALTSPMVPTPFRVSRNPNPAPVPFNKQGGQTYISPNNVGKPPVSQTAKPSPHPNPYNRPLSAKDIVSDLLSQNHQKMVKTFGSSPSSGIPSSSSPSMLGSASSASSSSSGGSAFPVNSFMRPPSAVRKDTKVVQKDIPPPKELGMLQREAHIFQKEAPSVSSSTTIKEQSGKSSSSSDVGGKKMVKQITENIENETTTTRVKSASQKTVTQQGDQVITRQGMNGVTVIQKVAAPPNFGTQINTIISKVTESKPEVVPSANPSSKPATIKHSLSSSSLPKPGMSSNSSSNSTAKESPSKIRNMNYTPTKPYEEVKDPQSNSTSTSKTAKEEEKKSKHQPATLETPISEKKPPKPDTWATHLKQTSLSSSPVAGNGTSYYRKESKSEIMLHEQRPPVLGAPAKNKKILDKVDVGKTEDDGEEDEEEEDGSTPG